MRLRLSVQRNGLPAANILWSVPETNSPQAYTITRLLEDVNHIIPLEAEQWGLEHYVVEIGGFECLHFMSVSQVLKEDDHISIRPLMTAEVRARTLAGRHQISDNGQHLVDGVPFGRPYLRQPNRPVVRIPPRKRQRTDDAENGDRGDVMREMAAMALPEKLDEIQVAQADAQARGDFEVSEILTMMLEEIAKKGQPGMQPLAIEDAPSASGSRSGKVRPRQAAKTVQFKEPEVEQSEDSEYDEDFAPEGDSGDGDSMNGGSEDDSSSASDADSGDSSSDSDTSGSDSDSSSDSDSDNESDASSPPDILSSKGVPKNKTALTTPDSPKHVLPGAGLTTTRARNNRRTRSNRLRHLKEIGELPDDADLAALQTYEDLKKSQAQVFSQPLSKSSGKRKRLEDDEVSESQRDDTTELEQRKQELMARFSETSSTAVQENEPAQPQTPAAKPVKASSQESPIGEEQLPKKETPSRRMRPDVTAIGRILARQAARPATKKANTEPAVEEPPEPEGASDPDFWKTRINLSAFECWDEEFELSAPPFPFKQHWDSASNLMREKASKKKRKGGKKESSREWLPGEQEAEEDEEEEKIILDYDDVPVAVNPDAEINAAIEDQLRQDVATATQSDLPPFPENVSTLPDLASSDIKEGAVIVCKFFAVNPITITPEISEFKTATVEREGDSGSGAGTIQLKIAQRDLPKREKKFDGKGNRIYDAADAFLMEDEEEEEGLWEGQFSELLEPKLLKAA